MPHREKPASATTGSANKTKKSGKGKPTLPPAVPARPGSPLDASLAFAQIEPQMEALNPSQELAVNTDIPRAVAVVMGAAPHLLAMRPQMVEELPKFNIQLLDNLTTYALAAWFAHLLALPTPTPKQLKELLGEAAILRDDMLIAAEALAHKGYLDQTAVATVRAGASDIDKANDLVSLSALFTHSWEKVRSRTTVEWAEVQRAAELGPQLLVGLWAGDQQRSKTVKTADVRQRRAGAFTLFVRAYEECRRAVHHLRWNDDDADRIAPSLYYNRSRRSGSDAENHEPASTLATESSAPRSAAKGATQRPGAPRATPIQ